MSKVFVALALDHGDCQVVGVYHSYERARSEAERYLARTPGWSAPIADVQESELEDGARCVQTREVVAAK